VIVSNGVIVSDFTIQAQSATVGGDITSSMAVPVDTGTDFLGY
jgi:hypothetical protein